MAICTVATIRYAAPARSMADTSRAWTYESTTSLTSQGSVTTVAEYTQMEARPIVTRRPCPLRYFASRRTTLWS